MLQQWIQFIVEIEGIFNLLINLNLLPKNIHLLGVEIFSFHINYTYYSKQKNYFESNIETIFT